MCILGTPVSEHYINIHNENATTTFNYVTYVCKTHNLTMVIKIQVLRCYVFSVILCRVELCRLGAFEKWLYRRMLRLSQLGKIINVDILHRIEKAKKEY